jgi:hypothetical protein
MYRLACRALWALRDAGREQFQMVFIYSQFTFDGRLWLSRILGSSDPEAGKSKPGGFNPHVRRIAEKYPVRQRRQHQDDHKDKDYQLAVFGHLS